MADPKPAPGKRELERLLIGAGLSARAAKALLARGYSAVADEQTAAKEELADMAAELARRLRAG